MLHKLGSLREKTSEGMGLLVPESSKHGMELSFLSSLKRDILGKGYTVIEPFADHMHAFVHTSCI